ncbi:MAG TPA: tryptophan--tRNA ligase [bacterium]|nr:tryptophan--tRNA ligase [bacterium]
MERILSGIRPTGKMHLGNYFGAAINWVKLQDEYECYFPIVDWHALTTRYEDVSTLSQDVWDLILDLLSIGIDPERSALFIQSFSPDHAELHILLSMITPISWLERNPTLKDMTRNIDVREGMNYGLLGYPVLMAADILVYKATVVPVGADQIPHLELAREIARRFNYLYGEVFPEPAAKLTEGAVFPGIDGRKMSKSYNNYIGVTEDPESIKEKVMATVTDPQKIRLKDKGHPEVCNIFTFHKFFTSEIDIVEKECRNGDRGCVACKNQLYNNLINYFSPIREKRNYLQANLELVKDIVRNGQDKARKVSSATIAEVREHMGMSYGFRNT